MWILLSVSTCRRREEIINIWDVHFVGEINLCCHRNLVVQKKKIVKRVRNTMGKIGCWREEMRSKVKQMSEQLVQEMGWWREKWRVKERMNAPWHFGEYEGIEWYKLGEYDSRSLSFPNNSFFSPVLFFNLLLLLSFLPFPAPILCLASRSSLLRFYPGSQSVVCLAEGQTGRS